MNINYSFMHTAFGIITLALSYAALAKFGLMMAIPPGYATVFWPASGVALAAVYLFGNRMLVGVYLGYVISALSRDFPFKSFEQFAELLPNPLLIGVAATLQAFIGALLLKRCIGHHTTLSRLWDNVKLAVIGGPLSCLISCSLSAFVLYSMGTVPLDGLLYTWATWYVGDTLGVLIFTPLLILVFNRGVSLQRKIAAGVPLLVLFALVIVLFFVFKNNDKHNRVHEFENNIALMHKEVDEHFHEYLRDLDAFISFYKSSQIVTETEFHEFAENIFVSLRDARAVSWARLITPENYNTEFPRYVGNDFIYRRFNGERFVKAEVPKDENILPVFYSYSPETPQRAIGIDLYTHPDRREAIEQAMTSGNYQMTEPLWLLDRSEGQGFLIFAPLYAGGGAPQGRERERDFESVLMLVYRYYNVFQPVSKNWQSKGIQMNVYDEADNKNLLYASNPDTIANNLKDIEIYKEVPYTFLGRSLYFQYFVDANYNIANTSWGIWYALIISLAFTFISSVFLLVLTGQTAVIQNLVEKKTRELAESNTFLRMMMDNIPDLIFVKNDKFEIVDANSSFLKLYPPDKRDGIIGQTGLEQFPQEEWEGYLVQDKKAFAEGYAETEENVTDYRGITSTVVTKKVRFEDEAGTPFILAIARDVTEFLLIQQKLEAIMNTAADGLITIRHNGVIETFNEACEDIFGYQAQEVIGKNVTMLMPTDDALNHGAYLYNYEKGRKSTVIGKGREIRGLRKDGSTFPMYLAVADLDVGGRMMFSGIIRDITQEKEMLEALEQSRRELEKSNKELEQFAYVASHDLKAPLRHVTLSAGFLNESYADKLDESGRKFLKVMEESSEKMQKMIESLLEYSRVGRGNDKQMESIDLKQTIADVQETLGEVIKKRDVTIKARGLPKIHGNAILMEQLFQNLIQNAIKYCDTDVSPVIKINGKKIEGGYEISVADNGIGIAPEFAEKIFMVFQRLHRDGEYEGTGIGLSICQRIVEFHGGNIRLDLNYKNGSRFIISFPDPR